MKNIFVSIILAFLILNLNAQENPTHSTLVMGVPQYLLIGGVRIDIDKQTGVGNKWLIFSPSIYYNYTENSGSFSIGRNDYKRLLGAGLEVSRRIFLTKQVKNSGFYWSFGGGYKYFNLNVSDYLWETIPGNLVQYHLSSTQKDYSISIHSLSMNSIMGFQKEVYEALYIDVFVGFGIKYGIYDQPFGSFKRYNEAGWDYGYRGTMFVGGIRFGVGL